MPGKAVMMTNKLHVIKAVGSLKICARQKVGAESVKHAVHQR